MEKNRIIVLCVLIGGFIANAIAMEQKQPQKEMLVYSHGFCELVPYRCIVPSKIKSEEKVTLNDWFFRMVHAPNQEVKKFAYPETFKFSNTAFAQKTDMDILEKAIKQAKEKIKNNGDTYRKKFVLSGFSRGASTILNLLGTKTIDDLALAVVIAPFSSIQDVIKKKAPVLGNKGINLINNGIGLFLKNYDPNGIQPINAVKKIQEKNPNPPILLVSSESDKTCPYSGVKKMYEIIKKSGNSNVYFLSLKYNPHSTYFVFHKQTINTVVSALYKKHGCYFNPEYLTGINEKEFLQKYQPKTNVTPKSFLSRLCSIKRKLTSFLGNMDAPNSYITTAYLEQ